MTCAIKRIASQIQQGGSTRYLLLVTRNECSCRVYLINSLYVDTDGQLHNIKKKKKLLIFSKSMFKCGWSLNDHEVLGLVKL